MKMAIKDKKYTKYKKVYHKSLEIIVWLTKKIGMQSVILNIYVKYFRII